MIWYANNPGDVVDFEKQMRRKVHYVIRPDHLWANIANLARNDSDELLETLKAGFDYIENESFDSTFQGLFSEINLYSEKLGKNQAAKNKMLCGVVKEIAKGLAEFSTDIDALGDAYEYLIGQFAAGSGTKAGEFYTPQQILHHPLAHRHPRQPGARRRPGETPRQRLRLRLRLRLAPPQRP